MDRAGFGADAGAGLRPDEFRGFESFTVTCKTEDYARFPEEFLDQSPLLRRLVEVVDSGDASGRADIPALRQLWPELLTLDAWLARGAAARIRALFNA